MKKESICILVMALLIATTILPVVDTMNIDNIQETKKSGEFYYYSKPTRGLIKPIVLPPWLSKLMGAIRIISRIYTRLYISVNGISLPDVPVTLNAVNGTTSYFIINLSGVPAGLDITNGVYPGWSADQNATMILASDHIVTLYDSYDPALPAAYQDSDWDKVNWILNNKDNFTMMDIQEAIWHLIDEYPWGLISMNAQNLTLLAVNGYTPESGDILAIVASPLPNGTDSGVSCSLIEFEIPSITPDLSCRWTGGGTIGTMRNPRVTHGFELHCDVEQLPNNLEVNWGGDHFHLDVLTQVECSDDPSIDPRPPRAGCDTIHGWGEGQYNGVSGFHVEFIFTDAGEPGRVDWAWIHIADSDGDTVMEVSGFLKTGNQQAHRCTGGDV